MLKTSLRFLHRARHLTRNAANVYRKPFAFGLGTQFVRFRSSNKKLEDEETVTNHPDVKQVLQEMKQHFNEDDSQIDEVTTKKTSDVQVSKHLQEKFVLYRDQEAEVILDVHEELERMRDYGKESREFQTQLQETKYNLNLERGISGVFDVDDLVQVLRSENAVDICAIQISKELCYADYMVLASGRSPRHLKAIVEFVRKMYKRKKNKKDVHLRTQGGVSDWQALDMGNIVLHVMMPHVRDKYGIETLWSVGERYDRLSHQQEEPIFDAIQKHITFLQEMEPISNESSMTTSKSKN